MVNKDKDNCKEKDEDDITKNIKETLSDLVKNVVEITDVVRCSFSSSKHIQPVVLQRKADGRFAYKL